MKRFFLLILLALAVWGCGDEGLETLLDPSAVGAAPAQTDVVTAIPPHIQTYLFDKHGSRAELLARLIDLEHDDPQVDEEFMANWLLRVICQMDRQRDYYQKYINAGGIAVVGSQSVNDEFFIAARNIILKMTSKHPEIRRLLYTENSGFYIALVETPDSPKALPHSHMLSNATGACFASFCYAWVGYDRYAKGMKTFVHEFAHAMHSAITELDPTFQARLEKAYETAKAMGKWRQVDRHIVDGGVIELDAGIGYILNSPSEYWAEGVVYWYFRELYEERRAVQEAFAKHDPLLYALLSEWLHAGSFAGM